MVSLAVGGYNADQVRRQLHMEGGTREVQYRHELLNKDDGYLGELDQVQGTLTYNSLAEIKRTARYTIGRPLVDEIDWTNERIRSYFRLKMPDGGWAEWPLGILLLSSPTAQAGSVGRVQREVDAYDKSQILVEDKFDARYVVSAGQQYAAAVGLIINSAGIGKVNIPASPATLAAPLEWEVGTSKLAAVNDLLAAINYYSVTFDELGYATSAPYMEPGDRAVEYEYRTDGSSIVHPGTAQTLDLFGVPNVFVSVVSSPDRSVLTSTFINDNPASPLSTVRRGRRIVDVQTLTDIADQATLDAVTRRRAIAAGQIYGETRLSTACMPHHGYLNCLYVEDTSLNINHIYIEKSWEMELRAGGAMSHQLRRVIRL